MQKNRFWHFLGFPITVWHLLLWVLPANLRPAILLCVTAGKEGHRTEGIRFVPAEVLMNCVQGLGRWCGGLGRTCRSDSWTHSMVQNDGASCYGDQSGLVCISCCGNLDVLQIHHLMTMLFEIAEVVWVIKFQKQEPSLDWWTGCGTVWSLFLTHSLNLCLPLPVLQAVSNHGTMNVWAVIRLSN